MGGPSTPGDPMSDKPSNGLDTAISHVTKFSPLVDDDVGEQEAIENNIEVVNNNNIEEEYVEVDKVVNIKDSKNHPLEQVIVVEDMDPYLDDGMGDIVVGEPFCKVSCVETRRLMNQSPLHFAVLEVMDAYRDEGMADVIFGEPFLREVGINAKRFEGMITIHNGNEEVTYQMVRSHPRFKHHTNEQCNKIPSLLKDLAAKKSAKFVKYQSSGFLCVIVVMLVSRRIHNRHPCS
ncbi:hypothetical protein Tco_0494719 [Tanacetum coccineum]